MDFNGEGDAIASCKTMGFDFHLNAYSSFTSLTLSEKLGGEHG